MNESTCNDHHPMVYSPNEVQTRKSFYAACDECGWEGPARFGAKMAGQDAIAHAERAQ